LSPFILDFVVLLVEDSNVIFLKNNYFLIEKLLARAEQAPACWNCHTLVVSNYKKKKSLMPCTPSVADIISPVIIFFSSFISLSYFGKYTIVLIAIFFQVQTF
jgi:hypothetical protein